MCLVNRWGRILVCNPSLGRILEIDHLSAVGRTLDSFIEPTEAPSYQKFLEHFTQDHTAEYYYEGEFLTVGNRRAWWSLQFSEISRTGDGLYFVIVQDITLKKIYEEELREAHEQAERANSAKSQFLANMTHEIRTPIHTIIGMTELLSQTRLTSEQSDYVKQVVSAADSLLNLVNDVLDFSKIEAGKMVLDLSQCRMDVIVTQALELVAVKAYSKGLEIGVKLEPDFCTVVRADPLRIRQILVNLLTNAIKFTPSGGWIQLRGRLAGPAGSSDFVIEVEDSGIGIESDKLSRLFQPFYQADDSHTRHFGGTGLGLTICQQLARMMGGEIQVESQLGKGSTFRVRLRLELGQEAADPQLWSNLFRGKRLLVAESRPIENQNLQEMLLGWGCEVKSVLTGKGLLHLLAQDYRFDAAFLSSSLADHDVWSLADVIHSMRIEKGLPLILCTDPLHHLEVSRKKISARFAGYLVKPYLPNGVASVLIRALSGEPMAPPSSNVLDSHGNLSLLRGIQVLVAEDHEVNRALFQLILEQMGAKVTLAINGKEAVEQFLQHPCQLVFLDLQMPEMDGFEAARRIRAADPKVPIIGVSASAVKSEIEKAQQAGMNEFVTKPFKRQDLVHVLERLEVVRLQTEGEATASAEEHIINRSFDPKEALGTFMNRTDVVLRVLSAFLKKGDEDLQALRLALDKADLETCFKIGHALKGSSRNISAFRMGDLAAEIESLARQQREVELLEPVFMQLVHEWQRFRMEAELWMAGQNQPG